MKILLVKDHARKGKESFHVKTKDSTCAAFVIVIVIVIALQYRHERVKW